MLGAVVSLVLVAAGCVGPAPTPTPDPFSSLSDQAEARFREGLQAYQEGRYRDALNAFERARLLSPQPDPRIDDFIERARAALQPTPTPGPPTATPPPATPSPTPVFINRADPNADLGERYFGQVFLTIVPGRNLVPPATNEFYFEDQIGLYIENLDQRLRLPFSLRVFDLDTGRLVASARNEGVAPTAVSSPAAGGGAAATPGRTSTPGPATSTTPGPASAQDPTAFRVVRFWDRFVWYKEGGERPGRYRVELYANDTMTHAFDYLVGNVPVAMPQVPAVATPAFPGIEIPPGVAQPAPAAGAQPGAGAAQPGAAGGGKPDLAGTAAAAPPPPPPTPIPTPTFTPTPAPALTTQIGGVPTGMDVNLSNRRVFIADASGVVWTVDRTRPTLSTPFNIGRGVPVDIAVDQLTGNLYVAARAEPNVLVLNGQTGARLATIPLPVNPADIQLDSTLGLLFVVLPDQQAIATIDMRSGAVLRTTRSLAQVTGIAVDQANHVLYVAHLAGQISAMDGRTGQITSRASVSSAGLTGLTATPDRVFAINAATRELISFDPATRDVARFSLPEEPGAVVAGDTTGMVYVLGVRSNVVLRYRAADGAEQGRVLLNSRSGQSTLTLPQTRDFATLRARMAINRQDETVYVAQPEAGTLSIVPQVLFPILDVNASSAAGESVGEAAATPRALAAQRVPAAPGAAPAGGTPGVLAAMPVVLDDAPTLPPPPTATSIPPPPTPTLPPTATVGPTPTRTPPPGLVLRGQNAALPSFAGEPPIGLPAPVAAEPAAARSPRASGILPPIDWSLPIGRFYTQANGQPLGTSTRGYAVTDADGVRIWTGYQALGGPQRLGFPISKRFAWGGFVSQLTQRGLLQWSPSDASIRLGNVLDDLHAVGLDDRLERDFFIPRQLSNASEVGLAVAQVQARRLALLDAEPAIKARYFGLSDPLRDLGLPTSRAVNFGPVTVLRTQRGALQLWNTAQPWAKVGEVTLVEAGDLARDLGLFGPRESEPFQPTDPYRDVLEERIAYLRPDDGI